MENTIMNLPSGTLLQGGKYRIVRFISSGGFGCTYEAEHVMLRKQVAIKEFFVQDFCNRDKTTAHVTIGTQSKRGLVDKLRKKFIDEASAIAQMSHPNIVKVTDVFEENGTAYYVMDYINGKSLNELVNEQRALTELRALKYIRQVAEALKYVHDHNRLHLDVKPSNIMIDEHDDAILIDFGTSKQYDEVGGENTSTLIGKTPGYAPIEQMGNDVMKFTPATDIYALGATLYKLITGVTPLSANLLAGGDELVPLPSGTSKNISTVIASSMKIRKIDRPQNIDAFLAILNASDASRYSIDKEEKTIIDTPPTPPQRPVQVAPTPTPQPKPRPAPASQQTPRPSSQEKLSVNGSQQKKPISCMLVGCITCIVLGCIFAVVSMCDSSSTHDDTNTNNVSSSANPTYVTDAPMTYRNQTYTYTGSVNSERNAEGKGVGVYTSGTYEGNYVNGSREGEGNFTMANGKNIFKGSFKNNEYYQGRLTDLTNGSYFYGTFKDMRPYNGIWYESDGTVFCEIKNGIQKD